MHSKIRDILSGRKRKRLLEKLQYLDKKIPLITLEEEQLRLAQEKRDLRERFYQSAPLHELNAGIDDLISAVERYLTVQEDEDYARIIDHLATREITRETDITEIRDPLDRKIVFQHLMLKKRDVSDIRFGTLNTELVSLQQKLERIHTIISEKDDAEELRSVWTYILQDEQDTLDELNQRMVTIPVDETGALERELVSWRERLSCLEKYGHEYLSEQALELLAHDVRDYLPRKDVTCQEIYKGLGDSIITELKGCTGGEHKEKMIKKAMAKLIYGRLKKGM